MLFGLVGRGGREPGLALGRVRPRRRQTKLALELLDPRLQLRGRGGSDALALDLAGELANLLVRDHGALVQCGDLPALELDLALERRSGLHRAVALGGGLGQRRLGAGQRLLGLEQLGPRVVPALLMLQTHNAIPGLLDPQLERLAGVRGRVALGGDRRACGVRFGARPIEIGPSRFCVGARTLHLGPSRFCVGARTLHLGSGRIGVISEPLPDQGHRSLELFRSIPLASERALEVRGVRGQRHLVISTLHVSGGPRPLELVQPGLRRLERGRELVVRAQRGVAFADRGGALGPCLGDRGLLLAIGRRRFLLGNHGPTGTSPPDCAATGVR